MSNQAQQKLSEVEVAQKVRDACIKAAQEGFRDASIQGLCNEGAVEAAVSSIQMLDLEKVLSETKEQ